MEIDNIKKPSFKNRIYRFVLPFIFLGMAAGGYFFIMTFKKGPSVSPPPVKRAPGVDVFVAQYSKEPVNISLSGTINPIHKTEIASEVNGKVVYVSESFVKGGFFRKNQLILKIDDLDYKDAVTIAESELAGVKLKREQETELAVQAEKDWKSLGKGVPTDLALRKPHIAQAEAEFKSALAALKKAKRDVEKTEIRAPFDCLVTGKLVSEGSFVTSGAPLSEIFNVNKGEIRIAVSPEDADFIDLPKPGTILKKGRTVEVSWRADQKIQKREGYISRTEGEIDPETRFQYLIVRVDDPYSLKKELPVLSVGRYVDVMVKGKKREDLVSLPASSVSHDNKVMKVSKENTIKFADVKVLKRIRDLVLVKGDILPGEKIVTSKLEFAVEGTKVKINKVKTGDENEIQ